MARTADNIRTHSREKYVVPARMRQLEKFSIRAGDVVRELKLLGRVPAVCSALKSRAFLEQNCLRIVDRTGPISGQSTTVTYTYEFVDGPDSPQANSDPWTELRGTLKSVFAGLGGGEAYLRGERENFYSDAGKENS
jgi:hypothetical protein